MEPTDSVNSQPDLNDFLASTSPQLTLDEISEGFERESRRFMRSLEL